MIVPFRPARLGLVALVALALAGPARAQLGRIPIAVEPLVETDGVHPGSDAKAAVRARLPRGYHVNSDRPLEDFLIPTVLTLDPPGGIEVREIVYPEAGFLNQAGADRPLAVFEEEFVIGVALAISGDLAAGDYLIPATLRYQACDEKMCYLPSSAQTAVALWVVAKGAPIARQHAEVFDRLSFGGRRPTSAAPSAPRPAAPAEQRDVVALLDEFAVLGTTGGYLNAGDFLEFVRAAEAGQAPQGFFEGKGPLAILALILIGGLALNLTPCVLPMIPINLAIIGAGAQAGSRMRGFALGGVYGLAMAAVYGVLGLVVILTAGTFGTINSSPWFNLAIAILFVALGLAMFDVIAIDFSRFQSRIRLGTGSRGSFLLAFAMGAIAALLAGACVAPVVIQVVLFSSDLYASGTRVALFLPFVLGFGMALPWPIAGAGLSALPKPGPWMVRVKHVFGVFILATAAYYGYVTYEIVSDRWVDADEVAGSVQEKIKEGWYASLGAGLEAARQENKLVLVDVWATWCKNCLTMDKTTFQDPGVKAGLADYVKVKFQAEDPSASPARDVMKRFDSVGLPTYAVLRARTAARAAGGQPASAPE